MAGRDNGSTSLDGFHVPAIIRKSTSIVWPTARAQSWSRLSAGVRKVLPLLRLANLGRAPIACIFWEMPADVGFFGLQICWAPLWRWTLRLSPLRRATYNPH